MKKHITTGILLSALLLSSGGALYYRQRAANYEKRWIDATEQLDHLPRPSARIETPRPIHLSGTDNTEQIIQEIDALLLELEQKDRKIAELQSATNRIKRARNIFSDEDRQARLEELKKTDPEAYEEVMARREERQNRIQTAFAERAATLLDRTPANLSEEEFEEREKMLQILDETWLLAEQMASPDIPRDERSKIRTELAEKTKILKPMLADERDRQLYELGTASGYSEADTELFVDYIRETYRATSLPTQGRRR
jgi:hypothetical protein